MVLSDGSKYEISPDVIENQPPILNGSFYEQIPDEKGIINYSKMKFRNRREKIVVPAGLFECYRFSVITDEKDTFSDEGFDLWRSEIVPILGMVRMEFSKTQYYRKRDYKINSSLKRKNWFERIFVLFFNKNIPGREREDMHLLQLLKFGTKKDIVL